ncbi:hypothetical protein LWI29_017526 [Acer saccharum]|uniref:RRM domain-containing protein n=1 Tax=Acer saccharum TaxID=4024 RepID=A0AA39W8L6_ACESA|nr:hypothetical protein LWI29_017526 [Acer saccharum]
MTRKGTSADDLFLLFDKYDKVVDIFIPRNRRTGESRGLAFVRYKYSDEAQKAVEKLDGRVVDGREIMVQFAKYGPNAERIHKGKVSETSSKMRGRSRSRSPRPRYRDEYRDKDSRKRSRSRSRDGHDRDKYHGKERDHRHRSMSRSVSPNLTSTVGGTDMMKSSVVGADPMEVFPHVVNHLFPEVHLHIDPGLMNDEAAFHVVAICLD